MAPRPPTGRDRHSLYYTASTRANRGTEGWEVSRRTRCGSRPWQSQPPLPRDRAQGCRDVRPLPQFPDRGTERMNMVDDSYSIVSSAPLPTRDSRHAYSSIRRPLAWGWRFAPGPDRIYNLGRLWLQFKGTGWSKPGQGEIEILGRRPLAARLYHGSAVPTRMALPARAVCRSRASQPLAAGSGVPLESVLARVADRLQAWYTASTLRSTKVQSWTRQDARTWFSPIAGRRDDQR